MRHVPVGILFIVAIFGVVGLLLTVSLLNEPSFFAVSVLPSSGGGGQNTVVVSLEPGESLANEVEALSGAQLYGLRSGNVQGQDVSTSYVQSLKFAEPGTFNGGSVQFGKNEQNVVSDFLQFTDSIFKLQVEFAPGLRSEVVSGSLPDIEDESIMLLGDSYTIIDSSVSGNRVSLRLFGGFGSIDLEDGNFMDDSYHQGVKVNGQTVDARVKIRATMASNKLTIFSIQYLLDADAAIGGNVEVLPLHCVREYLQHPLGLLSPNFDICYKGISAGAVSLPTVKGISGNEVRVRPAGDDEYYFVANNLLGRVYQIPVAQLPGNYGNKGRNFVFVEAANAAMPNINLGDYLLVNSKNDVQGVSNVLRYNSIDNTNNVINFEDLASGSRSATFDAGTGEGTLLVGDGSYRFVIGAGDSLAMDQTNDGSINGAEARFVLPGGSRIDFGPGFTIRIITPSKLFSDPMGDEISEFDITFGGDIDLNVPSPQNTVPGYTFEMISESGGVKQGLTKYGILYTWDKESESDDLTLVVPGAYAQSVKGGAGAEVFITLDRASLMKKTDAPAAVAKCGDAVIVKPEYCDPPGSACADQFRRSGICTADCAYCEYIRPAACGNALLEKGEECESGADCPAGFGCSGCKCLPVPPAVCGNNLLERGEMCESSVDCGANMLCQGCACVSSPVLEMPASSQPNIFARFFAWLSQLFGG